MFFTFLSSIILCILISRFDLDIAKVQFYLNLPADTAFPVSLKRTGKSEKKLPYVSISAGAD